MKTLATLLATCQYLELRGSPQTPVEGIAFDSRKLRRGDLFVALSGTNIDGAKFIGEAVARGAAAIITEHAIADIGIIPAVRVADARRALSSLAAEFYEHPSRKAVVIGITGTKGKTTTTYLLQSILKNHFGRAFRFGTVEYDLWFDRRPAKNTTPESLDVTALIEEARINGVHAGVMEVSSHALKTARVEDLHFAAAGFTNLSLEHTEFHPNMEDYYQTKRHLFFDLLPSGKTAVIAIDDTWGDRLARECCERGIPVSTVSLLDHTARIFAQNIEMTGSGSSFIIVAQGLRIPCTIRMPGAFNVMNALMAAALARSVDIDWPAIKAGLESVSNVPGRFETITNTRGLTVIIDYAHSPASLENVLKAVRPIAKGHVLTVFGCGGNRSHEKRPLMGRLAATLSDVTIVTSDNPRDERPEDIVAEIMAGITPLSVTERGSVKIEIDRRLAIEAAIEMAKPGDIVLIAGKGHETGQTFAGKILPFDDREVAREFLLKEITSHA
ncbi:MAG: UDP-N-acetylmuramoyl-L-alanyl-D-glutamate--2,6-diaminopimelate ligase [Candidatus Riflebacteria bacterium]|nr:UDP-N-acetylmuramoyl-L-alanyl-D-glutamate--2,6-diaminopimelate ligase [Candidatus Riflebacteria bacterium]